jgi:hypothetical protein
MRRPWNGAMPLTLTLPLRLERQPRVRQQRRRRVALCLLIALGVALLAAVFRLPARAERAQPLPSGAAQLTTVGKVPAAPSPRPRTHAAAWLATLAVGDELMLERPDGAVHAYEVASLDVVDSRRTELAPDADESVVVLVTDWPFENVTVGGSWRYVVTARSSF